MRPVIAPGGALQSSKAASGMASSGSTGTLSGVWGDTAATPGVTTSPDVPRALTLTPVPSSSAARPVVSRSSAVLHIAYGTAPSRVQSGYGGPLGFLACLEVMLSTQPPPRSAIPGLMIRQSLHGACACVWTISP